MLFQSRLLLQMEVSLQPLLPDGALVQIVTEGESAEKGAMKEKEVNAVSEE